MPRAFIACLLLAAGTAVSPVTAGQAIDLSSSTNKDAAAIAADYQVMRDVRYGPDNRQRMDLHLARDVSRLGSRNFTIVFLHGGGFSFGSRSDNTRYITPFLQKGLNVVNMSYRIGQGVTVATEDLTLALNHLAGSAETHRLRLDRPYFLSHGGRDDQIPPSTFIRFTAALSNSGVRHHIAFYPEAGHSKNAADLRETFVALFRFLDGLPH